MRKSGKELKNEWREDDVELLDCIVNSLYYIDNTYKGVFIIEACVKGVLNRLRVLEEQNKTQVQFIAEDLVGLHCGNLPNVATISEFGVAVRILLDQFKDELEKHYKEVLIYGIKTPFYLGSKEISGLMCGDIVKQIQKAEMNDIMRIIDGYVKELEDMNSKNIEKLEKIDDYLGKLKGDQLKPGYSTKDIIETILLVNNLQLKIKDDIYNNLTGNCLIEGQVELKK